MIGAGILLKIREPWEGVRQGCGDSLFSKRANVVGNTRGGNTARLLTLYTPEPACSTLH